MNNVKLEPAKCPVGGALSCAWGAARGINRGFLDADHNEGIEVEAIWLRDVLY